MAADRIYKCRVRPCQNVKGANNHWFVARIDGNNRLVVEKFDNMKRFEAAARTHGANEICSERCLHVHLSRWAGGKITASDRPECGSPAFRTPGSLTAWVSNVYNDDRDNKPARIIEYRDDGTLQKIWCFNETAFQRVEAAINAHVKFKIQSRGNYSVVVDVIEVLDSVRGEINGQPANT